MKRISLRHFTTHVQEYDEPVEVVLQIKGSGEVAPLGTWTPFSRPPVFSDASVPPGGEDLVEEIRQLKRQLAARQAITEIPGFDAVPTSAQHVSKPASNVRADRGFNTRPFTPVPKVGGKK
jgi:hypothetical protein